MLAHKHPETKFAKINAEKCPFLTDRLKVRVIPTLALIKVKPVSISMTEGAAPWQSLTTQPVPMMNVITVSMLHCNHICLYTQRS